jgi:hypothetical protein
MFFGKLNFLRFQDVLTISRDIFHFIAALFNGPMPAQSCTDIGLCNPTSHLGRTLPNTYICTSSLISIRDVAGVEAKHLEEGDYSYSKCSRTFKLYYYYVIINVRVSARFKYKLMGFMVYF